MISDEESNNEQTMRLSDTLLGALFGMAMASDTTLKFEGSCILGDESIMRPKGHGTSETPVQGDLRWDCDFALADRLCNFNRHWAEPSGYWEDPDVTFRDDTEELRRVGGEVTFYDSNTGKPLFRAPQGRTWDAWMAETEKHGWPSFRDEEVVWDNVRCLENGETVSLAGTHLGHNLPDDKGNRYCINLVSIAGNPAEYLLR